MTKRVPLSSIDDFVNPPDVPPAAAPAAAAPEQPTEPEAKPHEPELTTPLQTLFHRPEQTKLSSFNLPVSFRADLLEVAKETESTMTEVLLAAAKPQLDAWLAELRAKPRKRRR